MASFVPPLTGFDTVEAPVRAVIDDSGHRTALIGRFTGASVRAQAPCRSFVRPVTLAGAFPDAAADADRFWFAELNPLPDGLSEVALGVLGRTGAAMPRFFVGGLGIDQALAGGLFAQGAQLAQGSTLYLGATLGTCALAPRQWAERLLVAMTGEPDLQAWSDFAAALATGPALHVLTHTGQVPAPGEMRFEVDSGGTTATVTLDERGDLAPLAPALFALGTRVRMQAGPNAIPFHIAYGGTPRSSAEPDASEDQRWFAPSDLPAAFGTILCTDLDGWFGVRPAGIPLPRYHTGNRADGLLDGLETFTELRRDIEPLRAGAPADAHSYGAWFASWAFKNFRLIPGEDEPHFVDLVKELDAAANVSVRLLASKLVNFDGSETAEERRLMVTGLILAVGGIDCALRIAPVIGKGVTFRTGVIVRLTTALLVIATHPLFIDKISDLLDGSKDVLAALTPGDAATPRFALWSRYPATFEDNPASSPSLAHLLADALNLERIGVWHNKCQLIARPGPNAGDPPDYIGYLGGIDINDNRVESSGHSWPTDYHDVHAKLTGPAVADLFQSFYERWAHEQEHFRAGEGPAADNTCPCTNPRPGDVSARLLAPIPRTGDDIVQIARTVYRPTAANSSAAFWFAPQGEASVHDSVLRAIHQAREYIYIEDQFMAPPDSGGAGDEIIEALVEAAQRCKALILVFPEGTGDSQWMFGVERRNFLMGRLRDAWRLQPGRHFLPLIHARPLLDRTDAVASRRRTVLSDDIGEAATLIRVADGIRVPEAPCWAWIEGELVLVDTADTDTATGIATLTIERGTQGRHLHDVWPRPHKSGAPVTFARMDDVFIHAKMMLIDDVYASIGSANMNRRSMYHDGEISAQIVPEGLRGAARNPVRDIRARVWADHLGLPPETAPSALADPLEALPLFERSRAEGNRLVPYVMLDDMKPQGMAVERDTAIQILGTIFAGLGQLGGDLLRRTIYSSVVDPTSELDPFAATDPFAGP